MQVKYSDIETHFHVTTIILLESMMISGGLGTHLSSSNKSCGVNPSPRWRGPHPRDLGALFQPLFAAVDCLHGVIWAKSMANKFWWNGLTWAEWWISIEGEWWIWVQILKVQTIDTSKFDTTRSSDLSFDYQDLSGVILSNQRLASGLDAIVIYYPGSILAWSFCAPEILLLVIHCQRCLS